MIAKVRANEMIILSKEKNKNKNKYKYYKNINQMEADKMFRYVPARQYKEGQSYTLKVGFDDEFNVYKNALFRGEFDGELIFWEGGTPDGLIVLLHCNILESTEEA